MCPQADNPGAGFRRRLGELSRWNPQPELERLAQRLRGELERRGSDGLALRIEIDSLRPVGYRVGKDAIQVRVAARGSLQLAYQL